MTNPTRASPQHTGITPELVLRLARLTPPGEARVVSLYLGLDPTGDLATPRARRSEITSLIDQARRLAEAERGLSHDMRMRLRGDVARVRELLEHRTANGELARGARGLAVIACEPAGLLEAIRLPRTVRSRAWVARRPLIQPLAEIGPPRAWAALLCDGEVARLLEAHSEALVEVERFSDELRRRAGHGVWAPDHTDAPIPEDALAHVRRTVELLSERARARGYDQIAIATDERIWREIVRRLPGDVLDRVIGRFDIDADEASAVEVRTRAEPLLRAAAAERQQSALAQLPEQGACGLQPTLASLHERRVRVLLLREGLEHAGAECPHCGRAEAAPGRCELDGTPMDPEPNVIDWAVRRAIDQEAAILALHDGLERCKGIGALLRF